jgi:hypothetical protein
MLDYNHFNTPLVEGLKLKTNMNFPKVNTTHYRSPIGKLIFLINTKPNIPFIVNLIIIHMYRPQESHLKATKSFFLYFKGTVNARLFYKIGTNLAFIIITNANWGRRWRFYKTN